VPRWEPGVAVRALHPVLAGLRALGFDGEATLAAAPASGDPEARVPHRDMMEFWDRAVAATGDDNLGFHVAGAAPIHSFDVTGYAALWSPTLREAYQRACRYQRLIHDATTLALEVRQDGATLRHALPGGRPVERRVAEFLVATWVRFGRLVTGEEWSPLQVRFAHPRPADVGDHQRFFRAPLRFSAGENAIDLSLAVLDAPNARSDSGLLEVLDRHAGALLEKVPRWPSLAERVRAWLAEELLGGTPTAGAAALRLRMSVRSLSRGLAAEGTSFASLLEQLRRERAARLLADERREIAEVAFLLGFAELSAFYRAFRRWTGLTPAEFRRGGAGAAERTRPAPRRRRG
jgi:AraC-like DNA-binding protein